MTGELSRDELLAAVRSKSLDLSGRGLTRIPSEIGEIRELRTLNLSRNRLTTLPFQIVQLTSLNTLDLSDNLLAELPQEIGLLRNLHTLRLGGNRLSALSAWVGDLVGLEHLNLAKNQLAALPGRIGRLTSLQSLDLSNNRLTELPREIGQLTRLQTLRLDHNQLGALPSQIGQLRSLNVLNLSHNQLSILPRDLGELRNLHTLDTNENLVEVLPPQIGELSALRYLSLEGNRLTALPPQIGNLTALQNLFLDRNRITSLPDQIGQLTSLQNLHLDHNELTSLPQSLAGRIRDGLILQVAENPLPEILVGVLERGRADLVSYLESLDDAVALYVVKVTLVGEGGVGKTSLVAALKAEPFIENRPTTHGIEVHIVPVPHPHLPGQEIHLRIWDFGGQIFYRITHQFFFSSRALFILAWNARLGHIQGDVEGWLRRIRLRAPAEVAVILVATHGRDRQADIDYAELQRRFPGMLAGQLTIDSSPPAAGIGPLGTALANQAAALPNMGQAISARWLRARDAIIERARSSTHLSWDEFSALCQQPENGVTAQEARVLAGVLHDLGYIVYYGDDTGLRDVVVLNPEWLTKAISRVLEDEVTRAGHGVLDHARLGEIWGVTAGEGGWDERHYPYFLRLMEKFDISYRLEGEDRSLVAQLVSQRRPIDLPWDFGEPLGEGRSALRLVIDMADEAPGLVPWLTVRHHRASTARHWHRGVFLRHPYQPYESEALLELTANTRLVLEVRAPWPNMYFQSLRDGIEEIIRSRWPGLAFTVLIPCPGRTDDGRACPDHFQVEGLQRMQVLGDKVRRCETCQTQFNISALLTGFPDRDLGLEPSLVAIRDHLDGIEKAVVQLAVKGGIMQTTLKALSVEVQDCPRLFTLSPGKASIMSMLRVGTRPVELTLWCEHPEHWHEVGGATYTLHRPEPWLVAIAPYARVMIKLLRAVAPIVAGGAAGALAAGDPRIAQLDRMKRLIEALPSNVDIQDPLDGLDSGDGLDPNDPRFAVAVGYGARALRLLLRKEDPTSRFGGLSRVTAPDGDLLWVCQRHYPEYDPGLPVLATRRARPSPSEVATGTAW